MIRFGLCCAFRDQPIKFVNTTATSIGKMRRPAALAKLAGLCLANADALQRALQFCADQGIGVLPWSPLARGRLTRDWDDATARSETDEFGRTLYDTSDADRVVAERVADIADARGVTRAQVALAWHLTKPIVTAPIVGATKLEHLDDAVAALDLDLTADEVARLEGPYVPHAVAGFA